jgi:hypothetical protein
VRTLRTSCFWSVGRVWHDVYVEAGLVGGLRVARVVIRLRRRKAGVFCRSGFRCEEWIALGCFSSAIGVLMHECRVHVGRWCLLVCQTVVAIDPLARRSVMRLHHRTSDCRHHTHVRVPSAPCANLTVCRRCGAASPVWEDPVAAMFLLSSVHTTECENHDGNCNHSEHHA